MQVTGLVGAGACTSAGTNQGDAPSCTGVAPRCPELAFDRSASLSNFHGFSASFVPSLYPMILRALWHASWYCFWHHFGYSSEHHSEHEEVK